MIFDYVTRFIVDAILACKCFILKIRRTQLLNHSIYNSKLIYNVPITIKTFSSKSIHDVPIIV